MITIDSKKYLSEIKYIHEDIQSRIEEKNLLRQSVELKTTNYNSDKVQESGSGRFDDRYMKFLEVSDEINKKIDALIDLKVQVSNDIDRLANHEHRLILRLRYINLNSFENISVKMNYDIRHVHRLHGNALSAFSDDVMKCH